MPERRVCGSYKRSISDGNYGTEGAEVTFEWTLEGDDNEADELAEHLLNTACGLVLNQLRRSLSTNVRRAVSPARSIAPTRPAATDPADDEENLPF